MSELLNEIREKAVTRAVEIQKDINDAEELIKIYKKELASYLAVINATTLPQAPTGTSEATAAVMAVAASSDKTPRPAVYSKTEELPRHPHMGEVLSNTATKTAAQVAEPPVPHDRWSQYRVPPRVRRFLIEFGETKGRITHAQILVWYTKLNPWMTPGSQKQAVSDMAGILMRKGILRRHSPGVWSFTHARPRTTP